MPFLGPLGWVLGALAVAGVAAALALLLSPELREWPAALLERHLFPDANQISLKTVGGGKRPPPSSNVYRILTFGDSLTEGFTDGGNAFHPYAKRLGDLIYPQMPQGWHLEIEEQGESGERVLIGMNHRLQRTLDEHTAARRPYDWAVLLGGINDLADESSSPQEVMDGLGVLVQKCLAHGANVLLMTLLEVAMPEDALEQRRGQLNSLIREYVAQRRWDAAGAAGGSGGGPVQAEAARGGGGGGEAAAAAATAAARRRAAPGVFLFDLAEALPYGRMPEEQRWDVWDDGVHLTMRGYDHMGELITAGLLPLMRGELRALAEAAGGGAAVANGTAAARDGKKNE